MTDQAPLILGVSGLRGIVGKSLTPEVAVRYAAAFGSWLRKTRGDHASVCVARDGREGGEWVYQAAISGLLASGCTVRTLGIATTPTAGRAAASSTSGAVVITASHNPADWNGLKAIVVDSIEYEPDDEDDEFGDTLEIARAPSLSESKEIIAAYESGNVYDAEAHRLLLGAYQPPVTTHVASVYMNIEDREDGAGEPVEIGLLGGERQRTFRVVLDAVNASGGDVAMEFLREAGTHIVPLHADNSGIFPHTPEPTRENLSEPGGLCDAVPGLSADIGFAQDPDADRLAIIDERGEYIGEEYTLALCAEAVLTFPDSEDGTAPPVLVANLSTSRMIDDVAARHGAEVVRTPVGEANVVERMLELSAEGRRVVLGGEGNGGVIWPDVVHIRDSISSMALVLSLMARTGKTASELVDQINSYSTGGRGYAIVKRKTEIATKADAQPAVDAVARHFEGAAIDLQDGVRVDFAAGGPKPDWAGSWVHVRASNTEPIMRLICEAPTEAVAEAVLAATEAAIAAG